MFLQTQEKEQFRSDSVDFFYLIKAGLICKVKPSIEHAAVAVNGVGNT